MNTAGAIDGDFQAGVSRNGPNGRNGMAKVIESTNAQGNRSFTGYRQAPKPAGIDAGLNTGSAPAVNRTGSNQTPKPVSITTGLNSAGPAQKPTPIKAPASTGSTAFKTDQNGIGGRIVESTNAQGNRSFSGFSAGNRQPSPTNPVISAANRAANTDRGIASGLPNFNQLNPGANLPLSARVEQPKDKGSFVGNVLRSIHLDKVADLTPGYLDDAKRMADSGNYAGAAGRSLSGIAAPLVLDAGDAMVNTTGAVVGGIADFGKGFFGITDTDQAKPTTGTKKPAVQANADAGKAATTPEGKAAAQTDTAKPEADQYGITRGLTEDGRRSFSGTSVGAPGQVNTIDMGISDAQRTGRSGVANPAFEKALAAGDYETAMKMVNRGDTSQMTRLGQLQGQLRQQRDLAAAQAADRNYNGESAATRSAREAASRAMIENAQRLSNKGFSKGALRNIQAANGAETGGRSQAGTGIAAGINPSEISTADEYAQQQAATDVAQAQATQAQTTQRQQGILQGLVDQMNSPDLNDTQRQSLIERYQALTGGRNFIETQSVVGYDREGSPLLATVQMDPVTGQTLGGIDSNMPTYGQALMAALAKVKADPDSKPMVDAILMQQFGMGLPAMN